VDLRMKRVKLVKITLLSHVSDCTQELDLLCLTKGPALALNPRHQCAQTSMFHATMGPPTSHISFHLSTSRTKQLPPPSTTTPKAQCRHQPPNHPPTHPLSSSPHSQPTKPPSSTSTAAKLASGVSKQVAYPFLSLVPFADLAPLRRLPAHFLLVLGR